MERATEVGAGGLCRGTKSDERPPHRPRILLVICRTLRRPECHREAGGSMRAVFLSLIALSIGLTVAVRAQIMNNPIAPPILKRGLPVEIHELVRLPDPRA